MSADIRTKPSRGKDVVSHFIKAVERPEQQMRLTSRLGSKKKSTAVEMIRFFEAHHAKLPWRLEDSDTGKTLFLGHTVVSERPCTEGYHGEQLALRIVDVAAEFHPQVRAADVTDAQNTVVALFVGCSGHGKSTEINNLVWYLLGGEPDDPARLAVVADARSTQVVTCYRIRPLSPLFHGKTLLLVDMPTYANVPGISYVLDGVYQLFRTVMHVHAIFLVCRAKGTDAQQISHDLAAIQSIFAKDVLPCMHAIYTFTDVAAPRVRRILEEGYWPLENGEAMVNNVAFHGHGHEQVLKFSQGQQKVAQMLLGNEPVSLTASAFVVENRLAVEMVRMHDSKTGRKNSIIDA